MQLVVELDVDATAAKAIAEAGDQSRQHGRQVARSTRRIDWVNCSQLSVSCSSRRVSGLRQLVDARAAVVLRRRHLGLDQALDFQPVQRRIERSRLVFSASVRDLAQPVGDAPAVVGAEVEDLEHQEIQRALRQIGLLDHPHLSKVERIARVLSEVKRKMDAKPADTGSGLILIPGWFAGSLPSPWP